MFSTHCQYDYPIDVFVPTIETPTDGFPVLFVLDGQRYAQMIYNVLENQIRNAQKTKVAPMIIVSIGHHESDMIKRRFYDFTAPANKYTFPIRRGKEMKPTPVGGSLDFKHFLKDELMTAIQSQYHIDATKYYLFGHSLGGLFSLWTYLTEPTLFAKFVAVSPSIWWNNHELLQLLQQTKHKSLPPLAIYVGSDEGDMVDDAMTFYNHLSDCNKNTFFHIAMDENHASVIPTTISQALRFYARE